MREVYKETNKRQKFSYNSYNKCVNLDLIALYLLDLPFQKVSPLMFFHAC